MPKKILKPLSIALLTLFFAQQSLWADDGQLIQLVTHMQKQMEVMQKTIEKQNDKIERLERNRETGIPSTAIVPSGESAGSPPMSDYEFNERLNNATGGAQKWLKDLKFSGDLRLRSEFQQFTSGDPAETDDRNRFRYRLRYGFEKTFTPDMKIGFSMASGESVSGQNVDPTSTNQSFDNNFNFKDIFIEKAFATYTPAWANIGPINKFEVTAGKFTNPFEKGSSDMIWDRDVKPEGIYEKIDVGLIDGENVDVNSYLTAGQFVLDEDATSGGDAELFAYQAGVNTVMYTPFFDRPVDWLSAVSLYQYNDYATSSNFLIGTSSLARGNTVCATTTLCAGDFTTWEYYNEIAFYPGGLPVRPYFDFAHNIDNQALGNEGSAWAIGTKFGGIVKKGDWEIGVAYKRIEQESLVGAFNDSDFGLGHSGKRGPLIKLGYALTDHLTFNAAAAFVNNISAGTAGVRDEEQRRFQLDLVWKF